MLFQDTVYNNNNKNKSSCKFILDNYNIICQGNTCHYKSNPPIIKTHLPHNFLQESPPRLIISFTINSRLCNPPFPHILLHIDYNVLYVAIILSIMSIARMKTLSLWEIIIR
jgi:hypothetical protein